MIIIMTPEEYEELKPNRLMTVSKLNVIINSSNIEVVKNCYSSKGTYKINQFIRLLREAIKAMRAL